MYKKGDMQMTQLKTGDTYELVAALGRRTGQGRKFIVIGAYAPPSYSAEESRGMLTRISDLVRNFKRKYQAPYIVIGGDFNHRRIEMELREFRDIELVKTPPTRGRNTLDLVFTNIDVVDAGVVEPVANAEGTMSDHKTVYVRAKVDRVPEYDTEKYQYLHQTTEGDQQMGSFLEKVDWSQIAGIESPSDCVSRLHEIFEDGMTRSYELKKRIKKSSNCLLYTSPSPRDRQKSRMPSSA